MNTTVRQVYVLDGGSLEVEASSLISGKDCGTRVTVPVQLFLVETSHGYVLVDTGNDPNVIDDPIGTWGAELVKAVTPRMRPENHPYEQLGRLGLNAGDIKLVIYTHLHHDHAGGARFFPDALHIVQKAEYRWAFDPDTFTSRIYLKSDFSHENLSWQLAEGDWCVLPGVQLLSTPGHTPGHQSIVLWDVPDCGNVIIAGDAINCRENVERDAPPGFAPDLTATMNSVHRLTALAHATDALLLVSHETAFFDLLPQPPKPLHYVDAEVRQYYQRGVNRLYGQAKTGNLPLQIGA